LKKGYDTSLERGDTASLKKGDGFKLQDVESEKVEEVSLKREVVSLPVSVQLVMVPVLVALWLPLAMVLNDGVALSAVLLALQVYLVLSGLCHSQERSWPVVVLWGLTSSQSFFGFAHHATVTSLRFDAGFVGLRGEMSGFYLLFAGLLVGFNMLGSQVLLGLGLLPLLPLSLSVSKTPTNRLLLTTALQYILFHSFKTLMTMLTASLQRRHLMVWGVFSPRFLYEAAFLGVTHTSVLLSLLITSSLVTPTPSTPPRTQQSS
jgi:phosphatidylinositol glycan class O